MLRNFRPRVLLADDYPGMITALDRLLRASCDVVGHVADGADLLNAVALMRPGVIAYCSKGRSTLRSRGTLVVVQETAQPRTSTHTPSPVSRR
jgi:DNA-binding NarL/FixJ family response regulator